MWDTFRVSHILYHHKGRMAQTLFLMSVYRPHCSFSADADLIRGKYAGYFVGGNYWLVNYFNTQWSLWRSLRTLLFLKLDVSVIVLLHIHHNKGICHLPIVKWGHISEKWHSRWWYFILLGQIALILGFVGRQLFHKQHEVSETLCCFRVKSF